jgi:hypothetical protein
MKNMYFRRFGLCPILIIYLLFSSNSCTEQTSTSFQSLFDGQTFKGWEGDKEFFRIQDQAIVAGALDREIPLNQFLCTENEYENFELRLKVKFNSKENNGGIQFRSSRIPDHHEVIGYQADVGSTSAGYVWGGLYDESRRNKFLVEPDRELLESILNPEDWNNYLIRCDGDQINFWINNELVMRYQEVDEGIANSGIICVQIHSGLPSEAWYKDIEIKSFD